MNDRYTTTGNCMSITHYSYGNLRDFIVFRLSQRSSSFSHKIKVIHSCKSQEVKIIE